MGWPVLTPAKLEIAGLLNKNLKMYRCRTKKDCRISWAIGSADRRVWPRTSQICQKIARKSHSRALKLKSIDRRNRPGSPCQDRWTRVPWMSCWPLQAKWVRASCQSSVRNCQTSRCRPLKTDLTQLPKNQSSKGLASTLTSLSCQKKNSSATQT